LELRSLTYIIHNILLFLFIIGLLFNNKLLLCNIHYTYNTMNIECILLVETYVIFFSLWYRYIWGEPFAVFAQYLLPCNIVYWTNKNSFYITKYKINNYHVIITDIWLPVPPLVPYRIELWSVTPQTSGRSNIF